MSHRTRYFLIGSTLILTIGLGTGLVAYYGSGLTLARSSAGPAELVYVSPEAAAVAYADVHTIMNSEFRQKLRQMVPATGEGKDELLAETGIDIERDVDTVVAGFIPSADGTHPETASIVLVRGRFNTPNIETLAVNHGAVVENYRTVRLITFAHSPSEAGQAVTGAGAPATTQGVSAGVAFLEPDLVGLGTVAALKHAIDAKADRQDVSKNAEMMKLVNENFGLSHAWVVGQFDAISKSAQLPDQVRDRLPAIQWFAASVNVNGGVSGVLRADARDDQAAEQLRDAVRGGLAMVRLVSGNDPKLEKVLSGVQLSGSGKTVAVGFTVPSDVFDLINGVINEHGGRQHNPSQPDRLEKQLKSFQK
jgi:hypothetical protein